MSRDKQLGISVRGALHGALCVVREALIVTIPSGLAEAEGWHRADSLARWKGVSPLSGADGGVVSPSGARALELNAH